MILADTSIWVEHMQRSNAALFKLLTGRQIATHPFVIGQLALGGIARVWMESLREMPQLMVATDDEVLTFIDLHGLAGQRVGYVDAHLLASARLAGDAKILTLDRSMRSVAERLGIAASIN